jgi:hypothetical protein
MAHLVDDYESDSANCDKSHTREGGDTPESAITVDPRGIFVVVKKDPFATRLQIIAVRTSSGTTKDSGAAEKIK